VRSRPLVAVRLGGGKVFDKKRTQENPEGNNSLRLSQTGGDRGVSRDVRLGSRDRGGKRFRTGGRERIGLTGSRLRREGGLNQNGRVGDPGTALFTLVVVVDVGGSLQLYLTSA